MQISILIGTKNRPSILQRALRSVLNQDYPAFECLVLDDGSVPPIEDEDVPELDDSRVTLHRSEYSRGVAGGRNFLMARASGEVFCVLDDDAYFDDDQCLQRIAETYRERSNVGIVSFRILDYANGESPREIVPIAETAREHESDTPEIPELVSTFQGGGHALHRQVFEKCSGYKTDLTYGAEELDLSYKAIQSGFSILYNPEIIVHHYPEPSVVDGGRGEELYHMTKNRWYLSYRYLPFPYALSYIMIWTGYYGLRALRELTIANYLSGIWDSINMISDWERNTLDSEAIQYLKSHHGRLWY